MLTRYVRHCCGGKDELISIVFPWNQINNLWYVQNFRIALRRPYIISSKKVEGFDYVSSANSVTKANNKKEKTKGS